MSETTLKPIDVSALTGNTETIDVDPTANAFERSTPLRDAKYIALAKAPEGEDKKNMLRVGKISKGENAGKDYYLVAAEIKINEYFDRSRPSQELQGKQRTFTKTFSSIPVMRDGKPTSEIASLLIAMGANLRGPVSVTQLVTTLINALNAGTLVGVETVVTASIPTGNKKKDKAGIATDKDEYKTVRRGEGNFPKDDRGQPVYDFTVDGKQVFVRAEIEDFFRLS